MRVVFTAAVLLLTLSARSSDLRAQTATRPVVSTPTPQSPSPSSSQTPSQIPSQTDATAPSPSPAPKGTTDPDYVIGPGDDIDVNVFNEPKFSGRLPVRPDGMISVALVGDITASGFTPMQLSAEIASRLKKLITDPSVTVSVLAINSKRIYLVGEVGHVGPLAMTPGMTPLQAIATAGGLGPYANAKHIYILRTVGGKQEKIPFNYKRAIKDGDMQGVALLNGDTIVIP